MATINGTTGDDILNGTASDDTINGLEGNDTIHGGAGNDTIDAGAGNDIIYDEAGSDTILGGDGYDLIYAAADSANDSFDGGLNGTWRDGVNYDAALAGITVDLSAVSDQAKSTIGTTAGIGVDQLINIERVYGSAFNDTITGNSVANTLYGQAGNDTLSAGGGNDQLNGGAGDDILDGGAGSDIAMFDGGGAVTVSLAIAGTQNTGQGNDTLTNIESLGGAHLATR